MPTRTPSPIRLDPSDSLIVIHCKEHPWYRSCRFYLDEAQDAACAHEEREHPMDNHHREARRLRRLRRGASATTPKKYETDRRV